MRAGRHGQIPLLCAGFYALGWIADPAFLKARRTEPFRRSSPQHRRCFYHRLAQRSSSREYSDFLPFSTATTFVGLFALMHRIVARSHRGDAKGNLPRARESRWTLVRLQTAMRAEHAFVPVRSNSRKKLSRYPVRTVSTQLPPACQINTSDGSRPGRGRNAGHRDCRRAKFGRSDRIFPIPDSGTQ
jgi:hypothetical protein